MLHLTCREYTGVQVDGPADIMIRRIGRGRVELSIAAPAETNVVRSDAKDRTPKPRARRGISGLTNPHSGG